MLITTTNDVPGYEIQEILGEVFGLTVRSRHIGSQIGASFKSLVGGELGGMTKMLSEGREEAIRRLVAEAELKGANGDPRDAVRHLGARIDVDGDLRVRNSCEDQEAVRRDAYPRGVRATRRVAETPLRIAPTQTGRRQARAPARGPR